MSGSADSESPYTPLFCEENIWHLAQRMLQQAPPEPIWVLLFSNPCKQMVMFSQQRAGEQGYVVWDYHVVLQAGERVYDFDTTMSFPVAVHQYFFSSFPNQSTLAEQYRGCVRRIPAAAFVERFYSDRSHMQGLIGDDEYPVWPTIMPSHNQAIPLSDYWDMQKPLDDGSEVMDVSDYLQRLGASG